MRSNRSLRPMRSSGPAAWALPLAGSTSMLPIHASSEGLAGCCMSSTVNRSLRPACTSGQCTSGQCTSDRCTSGQCTSGQCTSSQCTSGQCTSGQCTSGQCTSLILIATTVTSNATSITTSNVSVLHHNVLACNTSAAGKILNGF